MRELRDSLARNDERGLDLASASLQDALYELTREVSEYSLEAKGEGFFDNIRRTIVGDDDPNYGFEERRPVRRVHPPIASLGCRARMPMMKIGATTMIGSKSARRYQGGAFRQVLMESSPNLD